ncbi:NAD(P)-binding protein [Aulographum hederae CBS 113979]|uniref:NAD(P)-binding protein n=1 Tax=Aulographum hederae CBS 113979 TaxID=1176131 RepID=A0A6G1HCR8_9PEZI|nr:NAD(P)-binding protein [Aulographum hederae CBS 113979]
MDQRISTILIIGATSGIGEGYARRFLAMGKKVIITGRRADRLSALKKELPDLEAREMDAADLASLPSQVDEILKAFPDIDTVFLNAGMQTSFSFFDPSSISDDAITNEITTNLTSPIILSRLFMPHLASLAESGKPANLLLTTSGLAYISFGFYPVYCPTQAAKHSFAVALRQQVNSAGAEVKKNLAIVEIAPPYVDTALDANHRARINELQGGKDTLVPPMGLEEYLDKSMEGLMEFAADGRLKKEVGVGIAQGGIDIWRGAFGPLLERLGIDA